MAALVTQTQDWTSESWRAMLHSSLSEVSVLIPEDIQIRREVVPKRFRVEPLPVAEPWLCKFVSYLADDKLNHCSIQTFLSGIR